jgi:hypothetical protein
VDALVTRSLEPYQVCLRKDLRGVDLISDALPFGRLWYDGSNAVGNAIGYAQHYSRSEGAVIRVYDKAGNVIETRERFQGVVRIAKQLGRFRGDPAQKEDLPSCSVLTQTASMRQEIDCKL